MTARKAKKKSGFVRVVDFATSVGGKLMLLGGGFAVISTAWVTFGLPYFITDRVLNATVADVHGKVGVKIEAAKTEVKTEVDKVTSAVKLLDVGLKQNAQETLETRQSTLYQSKLKLSSDKAAIEERLQHNAGDQFLRQAQSQNEQAIQYIDRELASVQSKLQAARTAH